jgi:hypothetical protein
MLEAQKGSRLTDAGEAAQEQNHHPFFKVIAGFPDQLKRAAQVMW